MKTRMQYALLGLGAADVHLTSDDIAELDAATPLPAVYPNWYIDSLTDQPVNQVLTSPRCRGRL
ncbi:MAG: hypothetical protein DLM60_18205 [Pseudonocardiales bacterium]|nr:MAG: hypothetical protein DLM60_18205 [Pseudonocardiales bacterium]